MTNFDFAAILLWVRYRSLQKEAAEAEEAYLAHIGDDDALGNQQRFKLVIELADRVDKLKKRLSEQETR